MLCGVPGCRIEGDHKHCSAPGCTWAGKGGYSKHRYKAHPHLVKTIHKKYETEAERVQAKRRSKYKYKSKIREVGCGPWTMHYDYGLHPSGTPSPFH